MMDLSEIIDKKTLIVGEINTGKTTLSANILKMLLEAGWAGRLAVLDLAPEMPAAVLAAKGLKGVGGPLLPPPGREVLYLHPRLVPPRLTAADEDEAVLLAQANRESIEPLFETLARSGREVLFINDLTLYLQSASAEDLIRRLNGFDTVVANAYHGHKLGAGRLTQWEKAQVEKLFTYFDRVIRLSPDALRP